MAKFNKGNVPWNKGKSGVMPTAWNKGKSMKEYSNCGFQKGHEFFGDKGNCTKNLLDENGHPWNKGLKKGDNPSMENMGYQKGHKINFGRKHSEESKQKMSLSNHKPWKGKKPWNYIDGRSKILGPARSGDNWKEIRMEVYKRDNFICQECGITMNELKVPFHVHHKIPFLQSFDNSLSNLITLCPSCHRRIEAEIMRELKNKDLEV